MAARPARPPALTLTCVFVGVGCALILLDLVSTLSSWGSIELQDAVRDALAQEPFREAGIGLDQALDYLRYAAYLAVVLAASGLVFAVYTARGHRASRICLTVLCGLAFLTFAAIGLAGLLPAAFAGVCAWSLWTPDARRWFDQLDGRAVVAPASAAASARPGGPQDPFATHPASTSAQPVEAVPAAAAPAPVTPSVRPRSISTAVVVTVVSCLVVGFLGVVMLLVSTVGADAYREALTEPGLAQDMLRASGIDAERVIELLRISAAVWLVLCAAGLGAAAATARRTSAGATALRVVAIVTIVASVVFLPLGAVSIGLAIVVLVQLSKPEARAWLAGE
jgi:hypothetical protein